MGVHEDHGHGAHGYSRSVTTVNYSFNDTGPVGGGDGVDGGGPEQRSVDGHEPRRYGGRRGDGGPADDVHVVNTYAVIVGQAQVVKSVTTSYAATVTNGVFTKITDTGAHGYSRSVTTVDYSFNQKRCSPIKPQRAWVQLFKNNGEL
jgi:hypothetical protein